MINRRVALGSSLSFGYYLRNLLGSKDKEKNKQPKYTIQLGKTIALKSAATGCYISGDVGGDGGFRCRHKELNEWCKFIVHNRGDGKIALQLEKNKKFMGMLHKSNLSHTAKLDAKCDLRVFAIKENVVQLVPHNDNFIIPYPSTSGIGAQLNMPSSWAFPRIHFVAWEIEKLNGKIDFVPHNSF